MRYVWPFLIVFALTVFRHALHAAYPDHTKRVDVILLSSAAVIWLVMYLITRALEAHLRRRG